jgi:hypothetical protein
MNFEELKAAIAAQATLAKSLSAAQVDAKGNAAVAAGAGKTNATNDEEDDDGDGNGDLGDGAPLVKSFKLVLEDGTEMEAQDATEMLKCLIGEVETVKAAAGAQVEELAKALGDAMGVIGDLSEGLKATREDVLALAQRGDELKKSNSLLTKALGGIGSQGRGVRSVTLGARPNLNGNTPVTTAHTPSEILAKAEGALTANQITATEAVRIQTALNMGAMPEQAILDRLFSK